jgi:regulator of cell morphogenesis and NO signaling
MSSPLEHATIGEIVANDYRTASVFDRFGLDFCCGGKRTLAEACRSQGVDPAAVVSALPASDEPPAESRGMPDATWTVDALAAYIVTTHHRYVREQAPVIASRLAKLVMVHGARHPELQTIAAHFGEVVDELHVHMRKEEELLFPYMCALAVAHRDGLAAPPNLFGTVRNPIRMMEAEHNSAGHELALIRELTRDYEVPADGCTAYRVGFEEMAAFDRDLRMHIHLENNVLFPKAVALEEAFAGAAG